MSKLEHQLKFRKFLASLGVKSARMSAMEEIILLAMEQIQSDFGRPDKLFMSSDAYEQLQKLTEDKK